MKLHWKMIVFLFYTIALKQNCGIVKNHRHDHQSKKIHANQKGVQYPIDVIILLNLFILFFLNNNII